MALCVRSENSDDCCCPSMPGALDTCPPFPPPPCKYFHEVGAEMVGNQLIIRMEKDKNKKNKKKRAWSPPCDCDVIEIKRPTATKGPRIVNGGDKNQILFRIHSKQHLNKKEDPYYKPQAIAYKINRAGTDDPEHCRKITVYPQLGGPVSQEVYSDHITEDNCDVYLLRVKKKNDSPEESHKRNLEVELRTPKLLPPLPPPPPKPPAPEPKPMELPSICQKKECYPPCDDEDDKDEKKNKKKGKKGNKNGKKGHKNGAKGGSKEKSRCKKC